MKKRFAIFSFILVFSLAGCMRHIEDENGDDTSLVSFTIQEKLDSGSFSNIGSYSRGSYSGGTTFASMYEDIDFDNISLLYDKFSGVSKIQATEVNDSDSFTITVVIGILSGNFGAVLVDPNNEIVVEFSEDNTSYTVDNAIEGIYFVIIGGETTEFEIDINRVFD